MALKLMLVAGARPNFMKIAPLLWEIQKRDDVDAFLVHTGQHYDAQMSERFFAELRIPAPDANLAVGSGSHAAQTAEVMKRFEPVLEQHKPDGVVVVGDVNSTLACALTAVKLGVPVAQQTEAKVETRRQAQLQNTELENRQKLWRWILLGTIGVLLIETWLAGRASRTAAVQGGSAA